MGDKNNRLEKAKDFLEITSRLIEDHKKTSELFAKYGRFENLNEEERRAFIKYSMDLDIPEKTFEEKYEKNLSSDFEKEENFNKQFENEADLHLYDLENFDKRNSKYNDKTNDQNTERKL